MDTALPAAAGDRRLRLTGLRGGLLGGDRRAGRISGRGLFGFSGGLAGGCCPFVTFMVIGHGSGMRGWRRD